jgi:hypothetical protein
MLATWCPLCCKAETAETAGVDDSSEQKCGLDQDEVAQDKSRDDVKTGTSSSELYKKESRADMLDKTPMGQALKSIKLEFPYLALPQHYLYQQVRDAEDCVIKGDEESAKNHLEHIELAVDQEEKTLASAFNSFKPPGKDVLQEGEVLYMLKYLGFPHTKEDVQNVMKAVDVDGDSTMSLAEFQTYVGRLGGIYKLFEIRRQQMKSKGGGDEDISKEHENSLLMAGIDQQAQAYWKIVVPPSEFLEAAKLTSCQQNALRHIRSLAKANHEAALPRLQQRCKALKYEDSDLWMTLAWIRELAPILVHLNLDKMMQFIEKDTHYRNQFETATSGGLLKPAVREKWERDLFGGQYDRAKGHERCKYGVLNPMNDYRGVVKCAQYGDSYIVLKDVRLRCTFSPEDSANLKADRLAVLDFYAHVLEEYSDKELAETIKVAKSTDAALLGDSSQVGSMKYKEAQLHGDIEFSKHVERLVANTRHRARDAKRIEKICKDKGWKFSWMDEERKRMEMEEKAKLGADAWKERMKAVMDAASGDPADVPEGQCFKGCGRPVQGGTTPSGKPYKTCCRGCAMGFGHDLTCGKLDVSKLAAGLCSNGCGLPVNKGTHPSGKPFTTCCRGCAKGQHDRWCGGSPDTNMSNMAPGLCKMGCGRKVAEGGGRKFDTCCRGCATGKEHSKNCKG